MKHKAIKIFAICLTMMAGTLPMHAQEPPQDEAAQEREFRERIDKQIDYLTESLNLEDWQVFYVDSILTHDYTALKEEMKGLGKAKVENYDIYQTVEDKWAETIYRAFHKVLNEAQWTKYLKVGAAREKKLRDKRAAGKK